MKIAVIGGGISGLASAYLLSRRFQVTLFEANSYPGGHTNTIQVEDGGASHAVDTGFVVFNDWTYPNFCKLLEQLEVESQDSDMSFSLRNEVSGLEYSGASFGTLFAQPRNLARPRFLRMLADIARFNRAAPRVLQRPTNGATVGQYLTQGAYSPEFVENYLLPVSASIWSSTPAQVRDFPLDFLVRFLNNHGILSVLRKPQWKVIKGGSKRYVEKLIRPFRQGLRLKCPVAALRRFEDRVEVKPQGLPWERFDHAVLAVHSDQALEMLQDPTEAERDVLGAIEYQRNATVLHTDRRMLPKRRRAWASWNYHLLPAPRGGVALTYHMNRLQRIQAEREFCVTLNREQAIDPQLTIRNFDYAHPIFSARALKAQKERHRIHGGRTHFCGAYWGCGFHEDGLNSALAVCREFGEAL